MSEVKSINIYTDDNILSLSLDDNWNECLSKIQKIGLQSASEISKDKRTDFNWYWAEYYTQAVTVRIGNMYSFRIGKHGIGLIDIYIDLKYTDEERLKNLLVSDEPIDIMEILTMLRLSSNEEDDDYEIDNIRFNTRLNNDSILQIIFLKNKSLEIMENLYEQYKN